MSVRFSPLTRLTEVGWGGAPFVIDRREPFLGLNTVIGFIQQNERAYTLAQLRARYSGKTSLTSIDLPNLQQTPTGFADLLVPSSDTAATNQGPAYDSAGAVIENADRPAFGYVAHDFPITGRLVVRGLELPSYTDYRQRIDWAAGSGSDTLTTRIRFRGSAFLGTWLETHELTKFVNTATGGSDSVASYMNAMRDKINADSNVATADTVVTGAPIRLRLSNKSDGFGCYPRVENVSGLTAGKWNLGLLSEGSVVSRPTIPGWIEPEEVTLTAIEVT